MLAKNLIDFSMRYPIEWTMQPPEFWEGMDMKRVLALAAALPIACGGSAQAGPQSVFLEVVYTAGSKVITVLVEKKSDVGAGIIAAAIYDALKSNVYGGAKPDAAEQKSKLASRINGCSHLDDGVIQCADGLYLHNWTKAQPVSPAITPVEKQTPYQPADRYVSFDGTLTHLDKAATRPIALPKETAAREYLDSLRKTFDNPFEDQTWPHRPADQRPTQTLKELASKRIALPTENATTLPNALEKTARSPSVEPNATPGIRHFEGLLSEQNIVPPIKLDPETQKLISAWVNRNLLK